MKKMAKWIVYILATFATTFIIPFSALSDFVAEHILINIGDGEEAYDNIDMITVALQMAISIAIVYTVVKTARIIISMLKKLDKLKV